MRINNIIKKFFRKIGIEIGRFNPTTSSLAQLAVALKHFQIDLVLDVGANYGQFASEIRGAGYQHSILSFEPLSSAYDQLKKSAIDDPLWEVYQRCALGANRHQAEINIAANSASSSLLPMLDAHLEAAPHTAYVAKEVVEIFTLDEVMSGKVGNYENIFLKIDTQGFESQVLDGAAEFLPHVRGVLLELSLVPLYDGQKLWQDLIQRMEVIGFELWALQPGFVDIHTGRMLQIDGLFFRAN